MRFLITIAILASLSPGLLADVASARQRIIDLVERYQAKLPPDVRERLAKEFLPLIRDDSIPLDEQQILSYFKNFETNEDPKVYGMIYAQLLCIRNYGQQEKLLQIYRQMPSSELGFSFLDTYRSMFSADLGENDFDLALEYLTDTVTWTRTPAALNHPMPEGAVAAALEFMISTRSKRMLMPVQKALDLPLLDGRRMELVSRAANQLGEAGIPLVTWYFKTINVNDPGSLPALEWSCEFISKWSGPEEAARVAAERARWLQMGLDVLNKYYERTPEGTVQPRREDDTEGKPAHNAESIPLGRGALPDAQQQPTERTGMGLHFERTEIDMGEIPQWATRPVTFRFTNDGDQTVKISGVRTSCDCFNREFTREVTPGGEGIAKIEYRTGDSVGAQEHHVWVQTEPLDVIELTIRANVRVDIKADPASVGFGNVQEGQGASADLTIWNPEFKPLGEVSLVSDKPGLGASVLGPKADEPGKICLRLRFEPKDMLGNAGGRLTIKAVVQGQEVVAKVPWSAIVVAATD